MPDDRQYIGLDAAGRSINRVVRVGDALHCYHDDDLLQIVTTPDSLAPAAETGRPPSQTPETTA